MIKYTLAGALGLVSILCSIVWAVDTPLLSGVDVIPRGVRGVDEAVRYADFAGYRKWIQAEKANQKAFSGLKETDPKVVSARRASIKSRKADAYMVQNWYKEIQSDSIIEKEGSKFLRRPLAYKKQKTKIIIHHTADIMPDVSTSESTKKTLNKIYNFHATQRGRGDIGYNYVIGPDGKVYEGRAGGHDVIGAHASFNNSESVGIALIGNFNTGAPSKEQLDGLIATIAGVTRQYNINIDNQVTYHAKSDVDPYIVDKVMDSVIGHRDVGDTSCPGSYLYDLMEYVKLGVKIQLGQNPLSIGWNKPTQTVMLPTMLRLPELKSTISIPLEIPTIQSCKSLSTNIDVSACSSDGKFVRLTIVNRNQTLHGYYPIVLSTPSATDTIVYVGLKSSSNPVQSVASSISAYITTQGPVTFPKSFNKIVTPLSYEDAQNLSKKDIRVMLYELSTQFTGLQVACPGGCRLTSSDGQIFTSIGKFSIQMRNTGLTLTTEGGRYILSDLTIDNIPQDIIQFTNYMRNSASKQPRNQYRGQIVLSRQPIRLLDGKYVTQYILTNILPLPKYMAGIAETYDGEALEKVKTMYLISKHYALYYMGKKNSHLFITSGSNFDLTDDPRINQKYVGAGYEGLSKKWLQATRELSGITLLYNSTIPILPYFACSPGFTRGAEKFGWSDTPYLQRRLDPLTCDAGGVFAGHGVGLSGKGANEFAKRGRSYRQILEYYYTSIEVR